MTSEHFVVAPSQVSQDRRDLGHPAFLDFSEPILALWDESTMPNSFLRLAESIPLKIGVFQGP